MADDPTADSIDEEETRDRARLFAKQVENLRRNARRFAEERVRSMSYDPRAVAVAMLVTCTEIQIRERSKQEAIDYLRAFAQAVEDGDLGFMLNPDLRAKLQ